MFLLPDIIYLIDKFYQFVERVFIANFFFSVFFHQFSLPTIDFQFFVGYFRHLLAFNEQHAHVRQEAP